MPQYGQAQTGALRSTPKQLKITASDRKALAFKNMGNNHNVPFFWADSATVVSGSAEVTLASGVKFYDMDLASFATVTVTPESDPGASYWLDYNTGDNIVKISFASAVSNDINFSVQFMLGVGIDISTLSTRGAGNPAQSYP